MCLAIANIYSLLGVAKLTDSVKLAGTLPRIRKSSLQHPVFEAYPTYNIIFKTSSVSIRRIIYKFLNVCPFDYTAVAVSGKVERS